MTVEVHRLQLVAGSSGLDRLQIDLNVTAQNAGRAERATDRVTSSIAQLAMAAGAGLSIGGLVRTADEMKLLQARLDVATGSMERNSAAMQTALEIAQSATAPLEAVVSLYSGVARAGRDMALSQQSITDVTNTVAKAMVVSGTTTAEAHGAITQFNQAMASGVLRGEEFNSVNEQLPRLMQAIADGFENADGSIGVMKGELRKLAETGQLTMDKVIPAIQRGMQAVESEAARVPTTVGGAWQRVANAAKIYIADANNASGATSEIAEKISSLAGQFDRMTDTATVLAGVVGVRLVVSLGASAAATASEMAARRIASIANIENLRTQEQLAIATARRAIAEKEAALVTLQKAEAANTAAISEARLAQGTTQAAAADARAVVTAEALNVARAQSVAASTAAATATTAQTVATGALATAQGAATISSRALAAASWLLTNPVGMLITMVGAGALAWYHYGDSATDAAKKVEEAKERLKGGGSTGEDIQALIDEGKALDVQIANLRQGIKNREFFYAARAKSELKALEEKRRINEEQQKLAIDNVEWQKKEDGAFADLDAGNIRAQIQKKNYRELLAIADDYKSKKEKINDQIETIEDKFKSATVGLGAGDEQYISALSARNRAISALNAQKAEIDRKENADALREQERRREIFERLASSLDDEETTLRNAYSQHLQIIKENTTEGAKRDSLIAALDKKLEEDLSKTTAQRSIDEWIDASLDHWASARGRLASMYESPVSSEVKLYEQRLVDIQTIGGGDDQRQKASDLFVKSVDQKLNLNQGDDVASQLAKEQELHAQKMEILNSALANKEGFEEQYRQRAEQLEREHQDRIKKIQQESISKQLSNASGLFGNMADIAKVFGGEQSKTYQAMFAVSKAFAVADSIMKIQQGIANAFALPFPENLLAAGTVASETASIISTIQSTTMQVAGAYDRGGYIPSGKVGLVGEYGPELVSGPSYVTGRKRTADAIEGGGSKVVVNIYNQAGVEVTQQESTGPDGARMLDVFITKAKNAVAQDIRDGGSTIARALEQTYPMRRGVNGR